MISVSCVIVLFDSEARGAAPSEVIISFVLFFGSGVNRGWGSGFINEFENSAKGIIFVKK
nr:MAG TPA: hypothetical protein [Caudoviricetes sp.]